MSPVPDRKRWTDSRIEPQPAFISNPHPMPHTTFRRSFVLTTGIAIAAMASLTLAASPVSASPANQPSVKKSRVFVVGDSLTVGSAPYLRRNLGPKVRSLTVDAKVGRFTRSGVAKLRSKKARRANIWVIALGTNDGPNRAQTKRNIKKIMRLSGQKRVIWVNIVRPGGYGAVNRVLRKADKARKRLTVLDWASVIRSKSRLLAGDGVHLSSSGYKVRAEWTTRTVVALGSSR